MDEKNVIRVEVFGAEYPIKAGEDPDYVTQVAAYVDRKMHEIGDRLPAGSLSKVAVLTALNLADELFKERERKSLETGSFDQLEASARHLEVVLAEME